MTFHGGPATPEWSVEVKAEEKERAAILTTVAEVKAAIRAILDAGETPDPALLDAVWKLVEA